MAAKPIAHRPEEGASSRALAAAPAHGDGLGVRLLQQLDYLRQGVGLMATPFSSAPLTVGLPGHFRTSANR